MFAKIIILIGLVQAAERQLQFNLRLDPEGNFDYDEPNVNTPVSERFDTSRMYISQKLKVTGDKTKPVGPNFTGKNEITCSWTSKKFGRQLTECCSSDEQCASGNCYMNSYCSDLCMKPPFWFNRLYVPNGYCCSENVACESNFCF